jgi:hypothetical protein
VEQTFRTAKHLLSTRPIFHKLDETIRGQESTGGSHRRNHQGAEKDAADRASIVAALERQLAKGDKALVGNTGYRRYPKTIGGDHFADNKFDGIFVLRTNTDLDPLAAMLCYRARPLRLPGRRSSPIWIH